MCLRWKRKSAKILTAQCDKRGEVNMDVIHLLIFTMKGFNRSSRPEVFCKKAVLRNFAKFTRKHLSWVSFLIKLHCNFIKKETLTQVFSCEFCQISENTFSHRTPLVSASGPWKLEIYQLKNVELFFIRNQFVKQWIRTLPDHNIFHHWL